MLLWRVGQLLARCGAPPAAASAGGAPVRGRRGLAAAAAWGPTEVRRTAEPGRLVPPEELSFGADFTDHMLTVQWKDGAWGAPVVRPLEPFALHPASPVLHYGMCCFEGMKAYHGADGRGRLFRPMLNMDRLATSMARLGFPAFDKAGLLESIKVLLREDRRFLPERDDYSIYIRPFAFGCNPSLGVAPSSEVTLAVTLSPVGPYFKAGLTPVKIFLDESNVRAWAGGVGAFKMGGNYAPTIKPQVDAAREHGCAQVLYTLPRGAGDAAISEVGAMNLFVLLRGADGALELATPALDGTILPGVTRRSILELAGGMDGVDGVAEREVTVSELERASAAGDLVELFATGTAAIVQPVGSLQRASGEVLVPSREVGPEALSVRLFNRISDLQYGRERGEFEAWSEPFEGAEGEAAAEAAAGA